MAPNTLILAPFVTLLLVKWSEMFMITTGCKKTLKVVSVVELAVAAFDCRVDAAILLLFSSSRSTGSI